MSIQNVPHTAGHSIILDPASFTLAQAPSRLPADTYDLVVSLGTDYHTFDRLLRWVKAYLAENPQIRCLIQHGHTSPIEGADNVKLLPAGTLKRLYAKAQVVLVQGGPGSIQDARATGAIPLVVPRRVEFDEVVDNHQVPFVTMMEKQGGAVIVESRADLFDKPLKIPHFFMRQSPMWRTQVSQRNSWRRGSITCFRGRLAVLRDT